MNKATRIQALADIAVKRGDCRRGSKNYKAYIKSLMNMSAEEVAKRYDAEAALEVKMDSAPSDVIKKLPQSQVKWMNENSKVISIRFTWSQDGDILDALEGKKATQEIRRLIRLGLEADKKEEDTQ